MSLINLFATPAIINPSMSPEERSEELEKMLIRSNATHLFTTGQISASDYLEIMDDSAVDVDGQLREWESILDNLRA